MPGAGAEPASRIELLDRLAAEVERCRACRLGESRRRSVFASGSPTARLMFVGEGPGAEEDRQGLPFVGPAGEKLDQMIAAMGFDRATETYIANVVKCRPPGNREPQPDEAAACRRFLDLQIDTVRPAVLVALGRVAAQALLGTDAPVGRLRGRWHEVRGIPLRVTYHPSAVLRNPAEYRRPTWEDLQLVRDRVRGTEGAGGPG
jgi:DNA polymerase